jgi:hypothetical protein
MEEEEDELCCQKKRIIIYSNSSRAQIRTNPKQYLFVVWPKSRTGRLIGEAFLFFFVFFFYLRSSKEKVYPKEKATRK